MAGTGTVAYPSWSSLGEKQRANIAAFVLENPGFLAELPNEYQEALTDSGE